MGPSASYRVIGWCVSVALVFTFLNSAECGQCKRFQRVPADYKSKGAFISKYGDFKIKALGHFDYAFKELELLKKVEVGGHKLIFDMPDKVLQHWGAILDMQDPSDLRVCVRIAIEKNEYGIVFTDWHDREAQVKAADFDNGEDIFPSNIFLPKSLTKALAQRKVPSPTDPDFFRLKSLLFRLEKEMGAAALYGFHPRNNCQTFVAAIYASFEPVSQIRPPTTQRCHQLRAAERNRGITAVVNKADPVMRCVNFPIEMYVHNAFRSDEPLPTHLCVKQAVANIGLEIARTLVSPEMQYVMLGMIIDYFL